MSTGIEKFQEAAVATESQSEWEAAFYKNGKAAEVQERLYNSVNDTPLLVSGGMRGG